MKRKARPAISAQHAKREILSLLLRGDKEIAADKGYRLGDVLKDAHRLLSK